MLRGETSLFRSQAPIPTLFQKFESLKKRSVDFFLFVGGGFYLARHRSILRSVESSTRTITRSVGSVSGTNTNKHFLLKLTVKLWHVFDRLLMHDLCKVGTSISGRSTNQSDLWKVQVIVVEVQITVIYGNVSHSKKSFVILVPTRSPSLTSTSS